jgi:type I restriction enzyme S subunit
MSQPALRFKKDDGSDFLDWVVDKLGNIGRVQMCKRIMREQTQPVGDVPFYKIGTFGKQADAYIANELYKSYKEKYSFPKKGDILISAAGTIGRTVVYDGLPAYFQDSNIVWIDNNEALLRNAFLYFLYSNIIWNTENTTIARLYNDNLRSISISYPSIPEQTKIANFLTAVDEKIAHLTQKHTLLTQYKKA